MNAFAETRNLFIDATGYDYSKPLSYESWNTKIPEDLKTAVLFVQFYDQITLAWYKTKSFFVVEEDAVSTILQYLMKNVPIIEKDSKRFKPSYIYKVAYNCLYCISHDIKRDIQRWENEVSNLVTCGEDTVDLFDTVADKDPIEEVLRKKEFWSIIENTDMKTQKVINHLLNGETLKKSKKSYEGDPLKEVAVSLDEMDEIIDNLRELLSAYSNN